MTNITGPNQNQDNNPPNQNNENKEVKETLPTWEDVKNNPDVERDWAKLWVKFIMPYDVAKEHNKLEYKQNLINTGVENPDNKGTLANFYLSDLSYITGPCEKKDFDEVINRGNVDFNILYDHPQLSYKNVKDNPDENWEWDGLIWMWGFDVRKLINGEQIKCYNKINCPGYLDPNTARCTNNCGCPNPVHSQVIHFTIDQNTLQNMMNIMGIQNPGGLGEGS